MSVTCFSVCVNYADFLDIVAPINKQYLDRYIIITDTKDVATVEVCNKYNLEYIQTDRFYEKTNIFGKASALNYALDKIEIADWVLFLDSDIILPVNISEECDNLNIDNVYGMPRIFVETYAQYIAKDYSKLKIDNRLLLGYFQLIHNSIFNNFRFREFGDASKYDTHAATHFKKSSKGVSQLGESYVLHLGKAGGVNWSGRKAAKF
jgi:hypothetical protein